MVTTFNWLGQSGIEIVTTRSVQCGHWEGLLCYDLFLCIYSQPDLTLVQVIARASSVHSSSLHFVCPNKDDPSAVSRFTTSSYLLTATHTLQSNMSRDEFLTFTTPTPSPPSPSVPSSHHLPRAPAVVRTSALPRDFGVLVTDTLESPATFLLTYFIGRAVRDGRRTVVVGVAQGLEHYTGILRKNVSSDKTESGIVCPGCAEWEADRIMESSSLWAHALVPLRFFLPTPSPFSRIGCTITF